MNYLKAYTEAVGITPNKLSQLSGVTKERCRQLINEGTIGNAHRDTQKKIADALGVTVRDLVKGSSTMKNKLIEAEIKKATEHLARLLRNYSDSELYFHLTLFTKDTQCADDDMPGEVPDFYSYRLADLKEEEDGKTIMTDSGRIYYADVDGEEYIKKVMSYHEGRKNE